jgi:hypothetical protein
MATGGVERSAARLSFPPFLIAITPSLHGNGAPRLPVLNMMA